MTNASASTPPAPPTGEPAEPSPLLSGLMLVTDDAASAEVSPSAVPRPRLSLGQPTTRRWTLEQDLAAVAECGFDAVGLWTGKFRSLNRREVARAVRRSGAAVSSLSWVGGFTQGEEFDRRQVWYEATDRIKLAGEVGAGCVCVATGGTGSFTERHAAKNLIPETLKRLGAVAAEFHVSIAVQPMLGRQGRHSVVRSVFDTVDLVRRVGLPNVGMALPSLLMAYDRSLVNRVREFSEVVKLVKLSDCRVSGDRADCFGPGHFPGDGSLPLATLVRRLTESGYRGDFELDVHNADGWERGDHAADLRRTAEWFGGLFEDVPQPAAT